MILGRNADGTWFDVMRPFRETRLGWVQKEFLLFTFDSTQLPITNFETGVTGPEPIFDSGVSVKVVIEAALRDAPSTSAERIGTVALNVTIPVIERSGDNLFLKVNYLGNVGWIAEFLTRTGDDITTLPVAPGFEALVLDVEVIPPEVQLGQIERLRAYLSDKEEVAQATATFWTALNDGFVRPCAPHAPGDYVDYAISQRNIVELPELRFIGRSVRIITRDLNTSLQTLNRCGIYTQQEIASAYAQAVNASNLMRFVNRRLDIAERAIIRANE